MSDPFVAAPSPQALRNRGVPVSVHTLTEGQDGWERTYRDDDEPVLETRWVRITNADLAELEGEFGSLAGWEQALDAQSFRGMCQTIAILWRWRAPSDAVVGGTDLDVRRAGLALREGGIEWYAEAVSAAFLLSQGFTADAAGKRLRLTLLAQAKADKDSQTRLDAQIKSQEPEPEPPVSPPADPTPTPPTPQPQGGPTSSEPGSETGDSSTSSGI